MYARRPFSGSWSSNSGSGSSTVTKAPTGNLKKTLYNVFRRPGGRYKDCSRDQELGGRVGTSRGGGLNAVFARILGNPEMV
jgi:hypothetical protein